MGNVLFLWILVGILIKEAGSLEITGLQSGSKNCNLTLRFNPSSALLTGDRSLEIFKHANSRSDYSLLVCNVLSVSLLRGSSGESTFKRSLLSRVVTKKHDPTKVILQHNYFKHLPLDGVVVLVELDCQGRRCSLHSADNFKKKNIIESSWKAYKRKLLSLKTNNAVQNKNFPEVAPVVVAISGVIILIIALAMCACGGNNTREKALSDEVGGTEVDHHVIGVSTTEIKEDENVTEHEISVQNENPRSDNDRRSTSESKKSVEVTAQRNSQSLTENGQITPKGRTESQSSQLDKRSVGGESRPRSSGSRSSVDKVEEAALTSSAPEKTPESTEKEKEKTESEKEVPPAEKHSKEKSNSNEARTRNDSSEGTKKGAFRIPSRKRMGSGEGKEPKSSPEEHEEQKTKFWQRRKSSKAKTSIEEMEKISPKKEKKKKKSQSQKNQTPDPVPSPSRLANLPLPPTPSSFVDDEAQYEVVESRSKRPELKDPADANYDIVNTSKTRTYDKVNLVPKDPSRPSSDLYECINDEDAKMKRISSASNQYDVVETRSPPPKKEQPASLEYAYAVMASRDKPLIPTETSAGSGLYEVVTDEIKQQSGVLDSRKSDVEVEDDYAVVQKDPSKKRASKDGGDSQAENKKKLSRSGEIRPAPAPPPVSSLKSALNSSVRRRTQSEGDELNVERSDLPFDSISPPSDRPKTMVEVEQTYATVNMSMKKRHSVEDHHPSHEFAPASNLPEGFYEESDTPPPIPPSLYADLESIRTEKEVDKENGNQPVSSSIEPQKDDENAYEEVATKVDIKSIASRPIVSELKTTKAKQESLKSPEDPNGVLRRLKPPLGSPRNSVLSLSENRLSSGSHDYEVLTTPTKTTQTQKSSKSSISKEPALCEPSANDSDTKSGHSSKRNSANQDGSVDELLTYV